ncbi:amidohydrolase family protein [Massilia sp.]|uniref:amidohydrolase family protein n=1 Tax=Massilia sp. TaxID=1882437 RepID=UPI0028A9657B|nr:amidohydrolase family protein [Massilia sp.]
MHRFLLAPLLMAGLMISGGARGQGAPAGDFHQHVFSKETVAMIGPEAGLTPLGAEGVISLLDAAGIRKALLLSTAYMHGSPARKVDDEYRRVRAENDWTAAQAARFPDRLLAFCGFNPLKDYALVELHRCAAIPGLRRGIKLHFGNSDVQLEKPAHLARLREVFAAANAKGMAIVVHLRASIGKRRPYGEEQARIFLEHLLPAAPGVVVQVAHLAGAGPGFEDPPARAVLGVLAAAMARGAPQTRNLWFDVASVADRDLSPDAAALMARLIRQIGLGRVLYGTDAAQGDKLRPVDAWAAFRRLPLSEAEFARIAGNVPPYFR